MYIEGTQLNIIKAMYDKSTAHIILSGEKLKAFPSNIRNKSRMLTLATFIQHSIGIPSYSKPKRKIKGIQTEKAKVKCHGLQMSSQYRCVQSLSRVQLCNPMDCNSSGSSVHRTFQAKVLDRVAISYSKRSSWSRDWTRFSYIGRNFVKCVALDFDCVDHNKLFFKRW